MRVAFAFEIELAPEVDVITERDIVAYLTTPQHRDRGEILSVTNIRLRVLADQVRRTRESIDRTIALVDGLRAMVHA